MIIRPFAAAARILAGTGVVRAETENGVTHPGEDGGGDYIGVFSYDPKKPEIEAGASAGIVLSGVVQVRTGGRVFAGKRAVLAPDATGRFVCVPDGAGTFPICGLFLQNADEDEYVEMFVERGSVTILEEAGE
jgi:hypothetical protein